MEMPTREQIAYILWLGGFGEDPDRNWFMSDLLVDNKEFHKLVEEASAIKEATGDPAEAIRLRDGWIRKCAELLYDISYRLALPSDAPDINWRASETFWAALG
jgi:hypothetical protein